VNTADDSFWETVGNAGIYTAAAAVLVVVLKAAFDATADRAQQRRQRYAEMVAALVSWAELPFRIRRRSSNDPTVRAALVERTHELQERLVVHGAELSAECPWLSKRYDHALATVKAATAPRLNEAWKLPLITDVGDMNLSGWGPADVEGAVRSWRAELRWRFGWRRLLNPIRLLRQSMKTSGDVMSTARARVLNAAVPDDS